MTEKNKDLPHYYVDEQQLLETFVLLAQSYNKVCGQRDEARAVAAKQMAAIHEAMRWLDPDRGASMNRARAALLKVTSA